MLTYAIKRILLMIPTFFAISVLVFLLLNLGAGRPGGSELSGEGSQDAEKGDNRESYRIFKEQFNLERIALLLRTDTGLPLHYLAANTSLEILFDNKLAQLKEEYLVLTRKGALLVDAIAEQLS